MEKVGKKQITVKYATLEFLGHLDLRELREEKRCPACLGKGEVRYVTGYSCGWEYRCGNPTCGEIFITEARIPEKGEFDLALLRVSKFEKRMQDKRRELLEKGLT